MIFLISTSLFFFLAVTTKILLRRTVFAGCFEVVQWSKIWKILPLISFFHDWNLPKLSFVLLIKAKNLLYLAIYCGLGKYKIKCTRLTLPLRWWLNWLSSNQKFRWNSWKQKMEWPHRGQHVFLIHCLSHTFPHNQLCYLLQNTIIGLKSHVIHSDILYFI